MRARAYPLLSALAAPVALGLAACARPLPPLEAAPAPTATPAPTAVAAAAPTADPCPPGMTWDGKTCKEIDACNEEEAPGDKPKAEAPCATRAACEKQCAAGVSRRCTELAGMLDQGNDGAADPVGAVVLLKKACEDGEGGGCRARGRPPRRHRGPAARRCPRP
jgi:hypothetical protein